MVELAQPVAVSAEIDGCDGTQSLQSSILEGANRYLPVSQGPSFRQLQDLLVVQARAPARSVVVVSYGPGTKVRAFRF